MASTIQLRHGNMFAQPTDLIIIPCSTAGTITSAVQKELRAFDIRRPDVDMNFGDVKFELFEGASSIATYVGYAASVASDGTSSTSDDIAKIGDMPGTARFAAADQITSQGPPFSWVRSDSLRA